MRYLISTAALALCLAATTVQAAPITTASSVTYDNLGIWDFTVTPNGPTTLNLTTGQSVQVDGTFLAAYDPSSGGCDSCLHQLYLAGLPGLSGQINVFRDDAGNFNQGGTYSGTFTAPLIAGTYYIGANYTLQFDFVPGVVGATNTNGQVSYILNVADPVPEPASLVLLGTGLIGTVFARRRARARS